MTNHPPGVPSVHVASLAELRTRIEATRAAMTDSALGRHQARRPARGTQPTAAQSVDEVAAEVAQDIEDAEALTAVLVAVIAGDDEQAMAELAALAERDPDLVTAVQHWAEQLATMAAQAGSGIR